MAPSSTRNPEPPETSGTRVTPSPPQTMYTGFGLRRPARNDNPQPSTSTPVQPDTSRHSPGWHTVALDEDTGTADYYILNTDVLYEACNLSRPLLLRTSGVSCPSRLHARRSPDPYFCGLPGSHLRPDSVSTAHPALTSAAVRGLTSVPTPRPPST